MEKEKKQIVKLSSYLSSLKEYYELKSKATFWFGGILSLSEEYSSSEKQLIDDLSTSQRIETILFVNHALTATIGFYQKQLPKTIFPLLTLTRIIINPNEPIYQYAFINAKLACLNSLTVYSLKVKHYTYTKELYGQIIDILDLKINDQVNETCIITLSNYLRWLAVCKSNKESIQKGQYMLGQLYNKFLTKVYVNSKQYSNVIIDIFSILVAVYKQHSQVLTKCYQPLHILITNYYVDVVKSKKKLPDLLLDFIYKHKIQKHIAFFLEIHLESLQFYSRSQKIKANKFNSLTTIEEISPEKKLYRIQNMLQKSLEMLTQRKGRYGAIKPFTLERSMNLTNDYIFNKNLLTKSSFMTIQPDRNQPKSMQSPINLQKVSNLINLEPIQLKNKVGRKQILKERKFSKRQQPSYHKTLTFKIYSIFLEVNQDGILLSDYTKQNKRYIEWNTFCLIFERISTHFSFEEFLKIPIATYYDFVRILINHLTKTDNRQICIHVDPLPLLQINEFTKVYRQDGKFLKIALMSHYDVERYVGVIDCYLSEFQQFFKVVCENQYILSINKSLIRNFTTNHQKNIEKEDPTLFYIDFHKKKRQTTGAELELQLTVENLERCMDQRNCLYKAVFLLKNHLNLFVRILDSKNKNETPSSITIKIDNFSFENSFILPSSEISAISSKDNLKINRIIELPLSQLVHYFPLYGKEYKHYINLYGRMIVDCYGQFLCDSEEINLGGIHFEIVTYAAKTEIMQYGKYTTGVSAQLIGSKNRIWALIIRYYDLAWLDEKVVTMMNPYSQFLKGIQNYTDQQRKQILGNMLVEGSVRQTYLWLKKNGRLHERMSLMEYLDANRLI